MAIEMKHLERMNLEKYFVEEYGDDINKACWRYCEDFHSAEKNDKKQLALDIICYFEHAEGLSDMARQIFGIKFVDEVLAEVREQVYKQWNVKTNKSIRLEMFQFLRGW